MQRNGGRPQLSRRFSCPRSEASDNFLSEATARLALSGGAMTVSPMEQDRSKSQESVQSHHSHPPHHVNSDDDVQYHRMSQGRIIDDTYEQASEQGSCNGSEADWDQGNADLNSREQRPRGEPQACLFVASLAASRTDIQLVESVTKHFERWGPLLNVKVLKDWMQRPYSFVQFEHIQDAQRAMIEAQNTLIDGRHIRIEQARVNRTLFLLRFGRAATEQDLIDVLEQYGPVENVSIFQDLGPAKNKRYAFAKFAYRDDAIRAYMSLRNNSRWTVEWAPNLSTQNQFEKESVFVGQLNPELTTEAALHERFKQYGGIRRVHLVKRNKPGTNRPTAFAFIEFTDEQAARQAIEHEHNTLFFGSVIRVQHREASEYRIQRQNAAFQATQHLNTPHAIGPPPINMPAPVINASEYRGAYLPYRGPRGGRPMYYAAYYAYPPAGIPIAGPGFLPQTQPRAMYVSPGGLLRAPTRTPETNQTYYQRGIPYSTHTGHQPNKIMNTLPIYNHLKECIIRLLSQLVSTCMTKAHLWALWPQ
ncbi:hypothetical protein BX616_001043 [Lobosporangium transversale]|nr:hypothetical protein BX616_001043 [Lobosporangium transversale]